jgi:hypothetical protein
MAVPSERISQPDRRRHEWRSEEVDEMDKELEMEMEMARREMDEDGTTEYLRQVEEERKKEGAKE